jgi:tetratricopeptide (TPR) repeat protein
MRRSRDSTNMTTIPDMILKELVPHRHRRTLTVALIVAVFAVGAHAQQPSVAGCGPLENAFGPYDYRTERGHNLYLVESAHFTATVEALIKGNAGYLGSDLDYTLRAFPNHHRALISTMRYGEKLRSPQPPNMRYSVECYFLRALRFRDDDTTARILYAKFLDQNRRGSESVDQLTRAAKQAGDNGFTQFNVALLHLEAGRHDLALEHAHEAFRLGFERPDVRDKLSALGKWREPPSSAAPKDATSR